MKTITIEDQKHIDALKSIKEKSLALTQRGYSVADIAGILNVSEGTVSYHRRTPEVQTVVREKKAVDRDTLERATIGQKVTMLTQAGYSVSEITRALGVSEGTVSYHRRDPKVVEITLEKAEAELEYWTKKVAELKGE